MKKLITAFFLLLTLPSLSFAANFSGTWTFNAGGYIMTLVIDQNNNSAVINGGGGAGVNDGSTNVTVNPATNMITFTRLNKYLIQNGTPQVYTGYMYVKGPATMGGTWTYKGKTNGWHAVRQ